MQLKDFHLIFGRNIHYYLQILVVKKLDHKSLETFYWFGFAVTGANQLINLDPSK